MWFPSIIGSADFGSFQMCTRRGRRPPTDKLYLESLEDRTQLSAVHPLFDLAALTTRPFPSDRWTVADGTQSTGRGVNLRLPDLITPPPNYEDTFDDIRGARLQSSRTCDFGMSPAHGGEVNPLSRLRAFAASPAALNS